MIKITRRITTAAVWDIEGTDGAPAVPEGASGTGNEKENWGLPEYFYAGQYWSLRGVYCLWRDYFRGNHLTNMQGSVSLQCFSYYAAMQFAPGGLMEKKRLKAKYIGYEYSLQRCYKMKR